jgi:FlaA1/EpsC-like NDP-sugar epimerase
MNHLEHSDLSSTSSIPTVDLITIDVVAKPSLDTGVATPAIPTSVDDMLYELNESAAVPAVIKPPFHAGLLPEFDREDIGERALGVDEHSDYKSILITGGAGFIGSFMARKMVALYPEYQIVVVDKLDYCGSLNNLRAIKEASNFRFIRGDITSADFIRFVLHHLNIDAILHFAAQTHVDNSFGDSFEFTKNNVLGTHVLLEAAKEHGVKRFIHVSTDEVYGEVPHDKVRAIYQLFY